jgi:hypothetical protein
MHLTSRASPQRVQPPINVSHLSPLGPPTVTLPQNAINDEWKAEKSSNDLHRCLGQRGTATREAGQQRVRFETHMRLKSQVRSLFIHFLFY